MLYTHQSVCLSVCLGIGNQPSGNYVTERFVFNLLRGYFNLFSVVNPVVMSDRVVNVANSLETTYFVVMRVNLSFVSKIGTLFVTLQKVTTLQKEPYTYQTILNIDQSSWNCC